MLKLMCNGIWPIVAILLTTQVVGFDLQFGPNTVLVYESETGEQHHQFVVRIARFHPDILLEWDSANHQGTVHLHAAAFADAQRMTAAKLFEAGVDTESGNVMTKWFSLRLYRQLSERARAKAQVENRHVNLRLTGEAHYQLTVDKENVEISVIRVEDGYQNTWLVCKNPENPVIVEHSNPYYREKLTRVSTRTTNNLRWIKQLPPIK